MYMQHCFATLTERTPSYGSLKSYSVIASGVRCIGITSCSTSRPLSYITVSSEQGTTLSRGVSVAVLCTLELTLHPFLCS